MIRVGKFLVYGAICALSSMMFFACGGDSASSSAEDDAASVKTSEIDSLLDAYSITVEEGKLVKTFNDTVDKEKQVISFEEGFLPSWRCLVKNEKIQWGIVDVSVKMAPYKYLFVGDTLVLFNGESKGSFRDKGFMYVGGTAGNIEGTWTSTSCVYGKSKKESECRDEDGQKVGDIRIAENSFSMIVPGSVSDVLDSSDVTKVEKVGFKYKNNGVRTYLYKSLYTGKVVEFRAVSETVAHYTGDDETVYPEYTDELLESLGIESLSITDTGETFKIGGKTYSVEITRAEYLNGRGTDLNGFAELQVTLDGTACTYYDERTEAIPKFLCTDENAKYITDQMDSVDASGNAYTLALNYEKNNAEEFFACLKKILPEPTGSAKNFDKLTDFDM